MNKFYGRKLGTCTCNHCNVEFQKPQSELNRNEKIGRLNFCSRKCAGLNNIKNFGDGKNRYDISQHSNNRTDNYTKFKYHYRNIKKRNKTLDVTIEDLKEQWDKQNGICVFTGVQLVLSTYTKIIKDPIYTASLDRIDSSKGYVKGNIRWISRSMNWVKNEMNDDYVINLCNIITDYINKKRVQ